MSKDKATFYAQKVNDQPFQVEEPAELKSFRDNAPAGLYTLEYKRQRRKKTQSQLGYIFAGIIKTIKTECNETRQDGVDQLLKYLADPDIPKGQAATDDFLKELCYAIAPTYGDDGRRKTLRSMSTVEANSFIDRLQNIMAGFVEIEDPRPKENNAPT